MFGVAAAVAAVVMVMVMVIVMVMMVVGVWVCGRGVAWIYAHRLFIGMWLCSEAAGVWWPTEASVALCSSCVFPQPTGAWPWPPTPTSSTRPVVPLSNLMWEGWRLPLWRT